MLVERLFVHLGEPLLFGLVLALVALPLGLVGLHLRRRGRTSRLRWELAIAARRPLRDLAAGRVCFVGTWRSLDGGRALVEEEGGRAVVELGADAPAVGDGARVLVSGFATRQVAVPTGTHYREEARAWLVEAGPDDLIVAPVDAAERGLRAARVGAGVGTLLLAASVAVAVAVGALCYRAALEEAASLRSPTASIG